MVRRIESWMWRNFRWYRRMKIRQCSVWEVKP
jgi:hypothetical protein